MTQAELIELLDEFIKMGTMARIGSQKLAELSRAEIVRLQAENDELRAELARCG